MEKKFRTEKCPDNCRYRSKMAPFCGYCLDRIMREREEAQNGNRENETEDTEQAD